MVQCVKCGNEKPGLPNPPFRAGTRLAPLGVEIQEKICGDCYREWIAMSVKLVNETRLDTADPRGQELWLTQMKLFLNLAPATENGDPWARFLNQRVAVETTGGVKTLATLVNCAPDKLTFADFDGNAVPPGFAPSASGGHGGSGSGSIPRDAVVTLAAAPSVAPGAAAPPAAPHSH
jgi:Fe-S cluster biosynthesis and repair protein YggX